MQEVLIKDIGPISQLAIPVPEDGGVIVLTGRNGAGKSEALAATEKLIRGTGALTKRDRCLTAGVVSGFGATIKVGAKTTRSGELEVTSLEDRLHVSDLVDPQIKDPVAADAKRIKALVSLSGIEADKIQFGCGFENVVVPAIVNISDPIDAAAAAKRALEAEARQAEAHAAQFDAQAQAAARAIEGIDLNAESDAKKLQAAHTETVKAHAQLVSLRTSADQAAVRRADAAKKLDAEIATYTGLGAIEAQAQVEKLAIDGKRAADAVAAAEKALAEAKSSLDSIKLKYRAANEAKTAAEQHERLIQTFREALTQPVDPRPTDDQIKAAESAIAAASLAIEQGVIIRTAKAEHESLNFYRDGAEKAAARAQALRDAAARVDQSLSEAVACDELRVESGRLVTDTAERGPTHFSDLSVGQRWRIALRIAIRAVGERGVLVIPQEAWEGLDPENRAVIAEEVAGRKVTIITAEPSIGDLRATQFSH